MAAPTLDQGQHPAVDVVEPGIGAGKATAQPAETVDIYPTLAALAGLARPKEPMDGTDLTPVLHDPARVRGYAYHAYNRPNRIGQAIRTERYRLVRWTQERTGARDYECAPGVGRWATEDRLLLSLYLALPA